MPAATPAIFLRKSLRCVQGLIAAGIKIHDRLLRASESVARGAAMINRADVSVRLLSQVERS